MKHGNTARPGSVAADGWKSRVIAAVDPRRGLWRLIPAPVIAAVHFTVIYIATSVYCLRTDSGELNDLRLELGCVTALSVALIGFCAWAAWRRLRLVRGSREGTQKRRREVAFLARITLYLANLSWIGVLFLSAPLVFFGSCA